MKIVVMTQEERWNTKYEETIECKASSLQAG